MSALSDLQQRLASAPLFDDDLSRQLAAYQQRTSGRGSPVRGASQQPYHPGATPFRSVSQSIAGPTPASVFRSASRANTVGGGPVWRFQGNGGQLPPEIQRPAGVQWLLDYAGRAGPDQQQQQQQHHQQRRPVSPERDAGQQHQEHQRNRQQQQQQQQSAGAAVSTPRHGGHQNEANGRTGDRRRSQTPDTSRRSRARRRRPADPQSAPHVSALDLLNGRKVGGYPSDDPSDDGSPRVHRQRDSRAAGMGSATDLSTDAARRAEAQPQNAAAAKPVIPRRRRESDTDNSDGGRDARRAEPLDAEDWAWRKLENVDDNIERALARRGIQQARLREQGKFPPGTRVDGGMQTEAPPDDRSKHAEEMPPSHPRLVDEAAVLYHKRQQLMASAAAGAHHASDKTPPPPPYLLQPMGAQQEVTPHLIRSANAANAANDPSSPDAARPSANAANADQHQKSQREWSLAWARSPENRDPASPAMRTDVGQAAAAVADTRDELMSRLDRNQLQAEETLVSHRIADGSDDPRLVAARQHVADANRRAQDVPPPAGGYGSIADGDHKPFAHSEADRWQRAKALNETHDAASGGASGLVTSTGVNAAALRHWAHAHATQAERKAGRSELPSTRGQRDGYSGRRKWGHVTFGGTDAPEADPAEQERRQRAELDYRIEHMELERARQQQQQQQQPAADDETAAAAAPSGFAQASYGFLAGRNEGALDKTHREARAMFPGELLS